MNKILNLIYQKKEDDPKSLACKDENGSFTWEDFFNFSYCVCKVFKDHGIKQGDCVTIELANCKEFLAIICACEMLGVAYVSVGVLYPEPKVKFVREHSDSKLFIDYTVFKEIVGLYKSSINSYNQLAIDKKDFYNYEGSETETIVYTSGTTGSPKGVVFSADNFYATINRTMTSIDNCIRVNNVALCLPFCFIGGLQYAIGELIHPTETVIIAAMQLLKSPVDLRNFIITNNIERILLTPSFSKALNFEGTFVKTLALGSENPKDYYNEFVEELWNGYGSTETGGPISWYKLDDSKIWASGKTVDDTKIYILDDNLNPVEEGEIYVAGSATMGYYKNENETKKVYLENPFYDKDGFKTIVKTGDYGKFLPDGNLMYINRKSNMVKINGQRVELEEIEQALKAIDNINDAVVKGFENSDGSSYLVAYYIVSELVGEDIIRDALSKKLPAYMIPSFFVKMDKFPLSSTGKVNLNELQPPNAEEVKSNYVSPSNDIESMICSAFEKVFNQEKIGIEDDFIKLGGDSITVIKILSILDNININVIDILQYRTPKKIAENVSKKEKIKISYDAQKYYPLSNMAYYEFNSLNLLDDNLKKEMLAYNMTYVLLIKRKKPEDIKNAVSKILDIHPLLKSKITIVDEKPCYVRRDDWTPEILIEKVNTDLDADYFKNITKPFNLLEDDLFRCKIFQYDDSCYLYLDIQHTLSDAYSHMVLFNDLFCLLNDKKVNPENINTFDLLLYNDEVQSKNNDSDKKYFDSILQGRNISKISPSENYDSNNFPTYAEIIRYVNRNNVDDFCKKNNISSANLFLACFMLALSKTKNLQEVLLFMFSHGRNLNSAIDDSNNVGCLYKEYPVVYEHDKNDTIIKIAKDLKTQILETITHDFNYKQFPQYITQHNIVFNYIAQDINSAELRSKTEIIDAELIPLNLNLFANLLVTLTVDDGEDNTYKLIVERNISLYSEEDIQDLAQETFKLIDETIK